ncbi:hypothetical protein Avbf_14989 [Armadillidium vulgare]|nr:hypothetical protein Avbf_14989 [Armadillidium vulgare]
MEGSTILSKSNTNIRPAELKLWSWESSSSGIRVAQRVPVVGGLYSRPVHDIRFNCEMVGPAGVYSVRVVSDINSSPIIAQSLTFLVDWAEEFTLYIPRSNLIPCLSPVPVIYTQPMCVGSQEKIRLYAHVRANVTSANPPMYLKYITEKRAINRSTTFDCLYFTDEPSEYCFIYVNRASSGAVSDVRRQCIATFKPNGLGVPPSQKNIKNKINNQYK